MIIKKLLWPVAFISALLSTGAGARVQGIEGDAGIFEPLFYASTIISTILLIGLLVDDRLDIGSLYRGSDTLTMRVGVITVGDVAIIILVLGFIFSGIGLLVLTLALFTHGTFANKETLALHAEWDEEKAAGDARWAAKKEALNQSH